MKVTIKNREIELRYKMRALMLFEAVAHESFAPNSLTALVQFAYCIIISTDKDLVLSYDDFVDWLDDQPDFVPQFSEWLNEVAKMNSQFNRQEEKPSEKPSAKKKKKVTE